MVKVTVVTLENYASLLPSILHHIGRADFISFDTELTGLCTEPSNKYFLFDTPSERHLKLKDSATEQALLQIGLTLFERKNNKKKKFSSTTYSFHLFPTPPSIPGIPNALGDYRKFSSQISSILFLREHKFDFNKSFNEGISYMSRQEESLIRKKIKTKSEELVTLTPQDQSFINEQFSFIHQWLSSVKVGKDKGEGDSKGECEEELERGKDSTATETPTETPKSFILKPMTSYQRLLMYQRLPLEFKDNLFVLKKLATNELQLSLRRGSDAAAAAAAANGDTKEETEEEKVEKKIQLSIGFRRIWDRICQRNIPLIGHNCWLDIEHMFAKFIGPISSDWDEFGRCWLNQFSTSTSSNPATLIDTKFLFLYLRNTLENFLPSLPSTLGSSLEALSRATENSDHWGCAVPLDGGKISSNTAFHDAGFDAFCTGRVFIGLAESLLLWRKAVGASGGGVSGGGEDIYQVIDSIFKGPCNNRLHMMASDYECGVSLGGFGVFGDNDHSFIINDDDDNSNSDNTTETTEITKTKATNNQNKYLMKPERKNIIVLSDWTFKIGANKKRSSSDELPQAAAAEIVRKEMIIDVLDKLKVCKFNSTNGNGEYSIHWRGRHCIFVMLGDDLLEEIDQIVDLDSSSVHVRSWCVYEESKLDLQAPSPMKKGKKH